MILSAVDFNTKGELWAVFRDDTLIAVEELAYPAHRDFAERLASPESYVHKLHYGDGLRERPDWYAIEGYVHFHDREGKMAGAYWTIRTTMAAARIKPLIIPPHSWKKEIGLAGNATKEAVKAHILNLYPDVSAKLPQDAYDAIAIGRAARRYLNNH